MMSRNTFPQMDAGQLTITKKIKSKVMKKITLITLALFASSYLFAQPQQTKVEQYCQVIASPRLFSNKVTIDIDFGEEKSIWRDNRLKAYDGKVKKSCTSCTCGLI